MIGDGRTTACLVFAEAGGRRASGREVGLSEQDGKRVAAERAADLVGDGVRIGLGTGSTAALFVDALGRRVAAGLKVRAVPTSEATRRRAEALGIPLATPEEEPELDLVVDGADEIGPGLALIKGGGGALLREKIVAASGRRRIVIADGSKQVATLGRFPLPIEIVPFGAEGTRRRVVDALGQVLGRAVGTEIRRGRDGAAFVTDGAHWILDARCGAIPDPRLLAGTLKGVLGVVEHGLFVDLAELALIGTPDGVMEVEARDQPRSGDRAP